MIRRTKRAIIAIIKNKGEWTGYLAVNKVHPAHIIELNVSIVHPGETFLPLIKM
ncbi:hypothetical protein [Niallia sp. 03133]|uniref:hypothetical protein n=1 Tax=Niallia sp. 03133 TaxID=3458060 RepID=UPI00404403DB